MNVLGHCENCTKQKIIDTSGWCQTCTDILKSVTKQWKQVTGYSIPYYVRDHLMAKVRQ